MQVEAMTVIETQPTWTTERIALLKNRIEAGLSCGQIAREIGVSRNAVIGKANRLGLSRFKSATAGQLGETGSRKNARPRIVTRHRILRALWAKPQLGFAEVSGDSANRCSLSELQQWHCRWPMGDPTAKDFGFCGNKPMDGLPYCPAHARIAYRPGTRHAVVRVLHCLG
jgi:GcrA cell cycle regulator